MGILREFRYDFFVARCRRALRAHNIKLANDYYEKFHESLNPCHVALGARIRVLQKNYEEGRMLFIKAKALIGNSENEDLRYIAEYCNYFLSLLDKDKRHEEFRIAANKFSPSSKVRDALPLQKGKFHVIDITQNVN